MVDLSKRACLYVLMCAAYNLVWTQEKICLRICLQLCLQLCWGGPLHLHHPLYSHQNSHSWCFFHSWDFYRHFFYTVTSLIGYHCILWYSSNPVQSCAGELDGSGVTIGCVLSIHSALLLLITLLLYPMEISRLPVICALI